MFNVAHNLFHEHRNFIQGFQTSSLASFQRFLSSQGNQPNRIAPCDLRFDRAWQDPLSTVMRWYHMQTETRFASIQHRRNREPPFFHEYLLIHLVDNSVCRLERIGEGSQAGAVLQSGCTSHDIIQWFPTEGDANSNSQSGSDLVTQVNFPVTFDLLEVLAICYSVQKCNQSSKYTLQRYNCYFLCYTVLTILTRRVTERQDHVEPSTHTRIVNHMSEALERMEHQPEDALEYLALGVCSLLENGNSTCAAAFIRGSLISKFNTVCHGLDQNVDITGILWHEDLYMGENLESLLLRHVKDAASTALESDTAAAAVLRTLPNEADRAETRPAGPESSRSLTPDILTSGTMHLASMILRALITRLHVPQYHIQGHTTPQTFNVKSSTVVETLLHIFPSSTAFTEALLAVPSINKLCVSLSNGMYELDYYSR